MWSCRDIRPELWEHARQALVFYFARRQYLPNAEDLAQQTLLAIWTREDFEFEKEEDFLRVCYGFARRVLHHEHRQQQRGATEELSPDSGSTPKPGSGLDAMEASVLLEEVIRIGRTQLRESDWKLIEAASTQNASEMEGVDNASIANKVRVRLSRARSRLARVTGWRST